MHPFALLFLLVSTLLGLWARGDDLNVVLFQFLDDETKLAQSCTDWLYVQHWHTVVPGPCNARDALGAHGIRRELSRVHSRHIASLFPFSRVVLISATIASVQADSAVPGVLFPRSCPHLCCASCSCITRRPLPQGQDCVDAARRLVPNFCGRSQCRRHQSLSLLLFVSRVVLSDNFECSFAFVWYFLKIWRAFLPLFVIQSGPLSVTCPS